MNKFYAVITTIQSPTQSVRQLASVLSRVVSGLIVIGDQKGPTCFELPELAGGQNNRVQFLNMEQQLDSKFELARDLPTNHYSRKNLGYLQAIKNGATCIYETDDDNAPLPSWKQRVERVVAFEGASVEWLNAYSYFSTEKIWPRGFPLDEINTHTASENSSQETLRSVIAPIQQGLANGSPDVDAVWRLVLDQSFDFVQGPSVSVPRGSWCPFNSQSTWWWPTAFPLMYLPSFCSFRMTDIWRSFIAQRCLWELGHGLVFHAPEVVQERNAHDLMRDFADEVDGYLRNKELVSILADLPLKAGPGCQKENLSSCYEALVSHHFFPEKELGLVKAWLDDLQEFGTGLELKTSEPS